MRRAWPPCTGFLAVLLCVVLLGACGSSSSKSSSSSTPSSSTPSSSPPASTPSSTSTPTSSPAPASSGAIQIKMLNIAFAPTAATAKVGQKVTWTNQDSVVHNVTATAGATFKSADFGAGKSFSYTPKKAGTIKYVCTIHPNMVATLTVTP